MAGAQKVFHKTAEIFKCLSIHYISLSRKSGTACKKLNKDVRLRLKKTFVRILPCFKSSLS